MHVAAGRPPHRRHRRVMAHQRHSGRIVYVPRRRIGTSHRQLASERRGELRAERHAHQRPAPRLHLHPPRKPHGRQSVGRRRPPTAQQCREPAGIQRTRHSGRRLHLGRSAGPHRRILRQRRQGDRTGVAAVALRRIRPRCRGAVADRRHFRNGGTRRRSDCNQRPGRQVRLRPPDDGPKHGRRPHTDGLRSRRDYPGRTTRRIRIHQLYAQAARRTRLLFRHEHHRPALRGRNLAAGRIRHGRTVESPHGRDSPPNSAQTRAAHWFQPGFRPFVRSLS